MQTAVVRTIIKLEAFQIELAPDTLNFNKKYDFGGPYLVRIIYSVVSSTKLCPILAIGNKFFPVRCDFRLYLF